MLKTLFEFSRKFIIFFKTQIKNIEVKLKFDVLD